MIRLSLARAVLKHYPSNFDFQIEQKIWNYNSFFLISVRPNTLEIITLAKRYIRRRKILFVGKLFLLKLSGIFD